LNSGKNTNLSISKAQGDPLYSKDKPTSLKLNSLGEKLYNLECFLFVSNTWFLEICSRYLRLHL